MMVQRIFTAATALGFTWLAAAQQPPVWQQMGPAADGGYHANYSADFSHSFGSDLNLADVSQGDLDASLLRLSYTTVFSTSQTYSWGLGLQWDYASFDGPAGVPVPEELHGLGLRIISNWRFGSRWTLRTDLRPGLYTDFADLSAEDLNVPFTIALGYDVNPDLQVVFAINADFRREFPIVGGPGVVWRFAEGWRLLLLLPRPQIEFSPTEKLTLFAGGELRALAARVAEDFGTANGGNALLNDDQVTYREIRVGAGARYAFNRWLRLSVEGGYALDRRFQFDRADLLLNGDGAPYVQVGLTGSF